LSGKLSWFRFGICGLLLTVPAALVLSLPIHARENGRAALEKNKRTGEEEDQRAKKEQAIREKVERMRRAKEGLQQDPKTRGLKKTAREKDTVPARPERKQEPKEKPAEKPVEKAPPAPKDDTPPVKKEETPKEKVEPGKDVKKDIEKEIKGEEIIKVSNLPDKWPEFAISRNIFSPDLMKPMVKPSENLRPPQPTPEEIKREREKLEKQQQTLQTEVTGNLFYEGYVYKRSKSCALVSSAGEFFAVLVGDIVLDKIKVIKIEKEVITVEFENSVFEIQLKEGDDKDE
jgi:hypothetical protein